ncbi:MAG: IPT/TIG domain-containing protein [Acidimicrobiales bacterium]
MGFVTAVASSGASATASTAPSVRLVSPDNGPLGGGTFVTISGSRFDGASAVDFGTNPAPTGWFVKNSDTIEAIAPAFTGTSTVVVTVTTPNGTSSTTQTSTNVFNYVTGPTIQNVAPGAGPLEGGTIVTIAGTSFSGVTGVTFNGVAAAYTVDSPTEITATTPVSESAGSVPVAVITSGGTTPVDPAAEFFYTNNPPAVISLSPTSGSQGTKVTIKGSHFLKNPVGATTVYFGSTPGTSVTVKGSSTITVDAPAGSGTVDVTVSDPNGTSSINEPADLFTYTPPPPPVAP